MDGKYSSQFCGLPSILFCRGPVLDGLHYRVWSCGLLLPSLPWVPCTSLIYFSKVLVLPDFLIDPVSSVLICNVLALIICLHVVFGFFEELSNRSSYHDYLCKQSLSDPDFSLFHYSRSVHLCHMCYLFYAIPQFRAMQ